MVREQEEKSLRISDIKNEILRVGLEKKKEEDKIREKLNMTKDFDIQMSNRKKKKAKIQNKTVNSSPNRA
jgi:hypothetical protein